MQLGPARQREGADLALDRGLDARRSRSRRTRRATSRSRCTSPPALKPGQYLAGISASVPLSAADTAANAGRRPGRPVSRWRCGSSGRSRSRSTSRVRGRPSSTVTGAEPKADARTASILGVHMANIGNAFAHGTGVIRVRRHQHRLLLQDRHLRRPAPRSCTRCRGRRPSCPGTHHVEVDLTYEGGRRTTLERDRRHRRRRRRASWRARYGT